MNWDSETRTWSELMRDQTKTKRDKAVQMRKGGSSVQDIADVLELSKSRVYELLKKNLNEN